MPHTITYEALTNVIPNQRLSIYEKVFKTTDPVELHGAYIWSVKVAACIFPLLSSLEVALRNSIHISATKAISIDWYDKIETRTRKKWNTAKRDANNIKWHESEINRIKKKLLKKTPPKGLNMHDLLVAKMDFGFWDNLLRECFSINGNQKALWPQCTPTVFPNLPDGYTNSLVQRKITVLRDLRNDIAHHSPVWKNKNVVDEQGALKYIEHIIDEILMIIQWLSKEKVNWLEVHMLEAEARRIASKEYLQLYQRKEMDELKEKYSCYKRQLRSKVKMLDKNEFNIFSTFNDDLYMVTKFSI